MKDALSVSIDIRLCAHDPAHEKLGISVMSMDVGCLLEMSEFELQIHLPSENESYQNYAYSLKQIVHVRFLLRRELVEANASVTAMKLMDSGATLLTMSFVGDDPDVLDIVSHYIDSKRKVIHKPRTQRQDAFPFDFYIRKSVVMFAAILLVGGSIYVFMTTFFNDIATNNNFETHEVLETNDTVNNGTGKGNTQDIVDHQWTTEEKKEFRQYATEIGLDYGDDLEAYVRQNFEARTGVSKEEAKAEWDTFSESDQTDIKGYLKQLKDSLGG